MAGGGGHPIFQGCDGRHYPGVREVRKVAAPAAGSDFSVKVPGGEQWRIVLGTAKLTTSAAVANRSVSAQLTVEGVLVWQSVPVLTVAASGTGTLFFQRSNGPLTANPGLPLADVPIPEVWLPDGATFALSTALIDAGDQWSAISLYVERMYRTDQGWSEHLSQRDRERRELLDALEHAAPHLS